MEFALKLVEYKGTHASWEDLTELVVSADTKG